MCVSSSYHSAEYVSLSHVFVDKAQAPSKPVVEKPPSNTLLCTNLPQEVTDDVLAVLFQQYRGFQSTHVIPSPTHPSKMATVYFESVDLASVAKSALDGFLLKKGWSMSVVFA